MWTLLLVIVVGLRGESAFADDAPITTRIGLRAGAELSSTVQWASGPNRRDEWVMLGLEVETFSDQFLFGAGVAAAGGPFSHGVLRASVHTGIHHALTTSVRTTATVGLGMQWIEPICPVFNTSPCGYVGMPFVGVGGTLGYAGDHVEVAVWAATLVDLGRDHVTNGNEYDIGGVTFGAGLTVAYLSRR